MIDDLEHKLLEAGRPEPRAEVRARVLAAAQPLVRRDCRRLDRIWFSRGWRLAAILVFGLIAALDALSGPPPSSPAMPNRPITDTDLAVEKAARTLGLTSIEAEALTAQAVAAGRRSGAMPLNPEALLGGSE